MKVFLIGYMGVGKSTIGRALAKQMGFPFLDLDQIIEKVEGNSISDIFSKNGEEAFRKIESKSLQNLMGSEEAFVLATGGGTPCTGSNLKEMKAVGIVVWLEMDIHPMLGRLHKAKATRPLISDLSPDELDAFVKRSYKKRKSIYHKAHIRYNCTTMHTEDYTSLANTILNYSK